MRTRIPSLLLALLLLGVSSGQADEPEKTPTKEGSDEEFIQRVYLDILGKPPTAEQVKQFLADKNAKKHDQLINQLLDVHGSFDAALEQALKNNPDILVAQAKVASAQAELNRVRLQVTQRLELLQRQHQAQRELVEHAEKNLARLGKLHERGAVTEAERDQAQRTLIETRAKLAEIDADLRLVMGRSAQQDREAATVRRALEFMLMQGDGVWRPADHAGVIWALTLNQPKAAGSISERLRQALDKQVAFDFKDMAVEDVFKSLQTTHAIPFLLSVKLGGAKVNLKLDKAPLGAGLQALEDFLPGIKLVVRDYGILVTSTDRLPQGAVSVHDFWKMPVKPAALPAAEDKKTK